MKRVLLLCRQSLTRRDGDSVSIAQQRETLTRHYEAKDCAVVGVIEQENTRAWKTKLGDRADLTQVMDLARQDAFDTLAVYDISRLARRVSVIETIAEELGELGKDLESFRESWLSDPFLRQLAGGIAQRQSAELSERMKHVWKYRASRGQYHGRAPLGFVRLDGKLAPDPNPATIALVNEAFTRYLAGAGSSAIAADFRLRTGQGWTARRVLDLLRNPAYVGTVTVGDTTQEHAHPPIVAPETFERAQQALSARRAPKSGIDHSWLSGLVWCGCSAPMYPVVIPKHKNGREYRTALFRCRWAGEPERCGQKRKSIAIHAVESAVVAMLLADMVAAAEADPAEVARQREIAQRQRYPDWPKRERELQRQITGYRESRISVIQMRQDLLISRDEVVARVKPIDAQIAEREHELATGPAPVDLGAIRAAHTVAVELADVLPALVGEVRVELREVLQSLGARVVVRDGVPDIEYPGMVGALVLRSS